MARLAGLPDRVVQRAAQMSAAKEADGAGGKQRQQGGGAGGAEGAEGEGAAPMDVDDDGERGSGVGGVGGGGGRAAGGAGGCRRGSRRSRSEAAARVSAARGRQRGSCVRAPASLRAGRPQAGPGPGRGLDPRPPVADRVK